MILQFPSTERARQIVREKAEQRGYGLLAQAQLARTFRPSNAGHSLCKPPSTSRTCTSPQLSRGMSHEQAYAGAVATQAP